MQYTFETSTVLEATDILAFKYFLIVRTLQVNITFRHEYKTVTQGICADYIFSLLAATRLSCSDLT